MAATLQVFPTVPVDTRRMWFTVGLAFAASLVMMLSITPASVSPVAYWAVSSVALATVLMVLVAGENAWDRMVASAQAAGVVER